MEGPRERYHAMLDQAMDATKQGEFFLPDFVRLILHDSKDASLQAQRGLALLRDAGKAGILRLHRDF